MEITPKSLAILITLPVLGLSLAASAGFNILMATSPVKDRNAYFREGYYVAVSQEEIIATLKVTAISQEEYHISQAIDTVKNGYGRYGSASLYSLEFRIKEDGLYEPYHFYGITNWTAQQFRGAYQKYQDVRGCFLIPPDGEYGYVTIILPDQTTYHLERSIS